MIAHKKYFYFSLLLIILFYIYQIIIVDKIFIFTDDVINEFAWYKALKNDNLLFSSNLLKKSSYFFNGIEIKYFNSPYDIKRIFYYFFDSLYAYLTSELVCRVIGFIGMYLFIKQNFKTINDELTICLISVSYICLPFYSIYGLSLIGQPFFLWAFINLINKEKIFISLILLIVFPFYSHIAFTTPFFIIYLLIVIFFNKRINGYYITGIVIYLVFSILANINLFEIILNKEITNRNYISNEHIFPTFFGVIFLTFKTIFFGYLHATNFNSIPIFTLLLLIIFKHKYNFNLYIKLLVLIFISSLIFATFPIIQFYISPYVKILKSFNFSRIIFLNTIIIYVIFLECISILLKENYKKYTITIISIQLLLNILINKEISYNIFNIETNQKIINRIADFDGLFRLKIINYKKEKDTRLIYVPYADEYSKILSKNLFSKVDQKIKKIKYEYRIASLGFPSSIAILNNMKTFDSDLDIYPMKYLTIFDQINEKELNKFDSKKFIPHGTEILSSELFLKYNEFKHTKYENWIKIYDLNINTKILKENKCDFILSCVEIVNYNKINLKFITKITDSNSIYDIYIYQL